MVTIGEVEFDVEADLSRFASTLEPQLKAAAERAEKNFGTIDITPELQTRKLLLDIKKAERRYRELSDAGEDVEKTEEARLRLLQKQNSLVRLQAREEQKLAKTQTSLMRGLARASEKRAKDEAKAANDAFKSQQRLAAETLKSVNARAKAEEKANNALLKQQAEIFRNAKKQRDQEIKFRVDRQAVVSEIASLSAAFAKVGAVKIETEVDQASAIASLESLKTRLAKTEANLILNPEIDSAEVRAEIASLRAQIASADLSIKVKTEVEDPPKTVLARLAGLFRRSGESSGKAFSNGFGTSIRSQAFSDPQAVILKLTATFAGLFAAITPLGPLLVGLAAATAAFAGVLGSLGVVAGVAAVGLSGFFGAVKNGGEALDDLTPSARQAAEGIRGLGDEWGVLRRAVQESIFSQVGDSFSRLDQTIRRGLQPGMVKIGASIGKIVDAFADWASSGPGIELISTILDRVADVFERLRPGLQAFGVGLLQLFNAALPSAGDLADSFTDIAKSFERWTKGLDDGKVNKISQAIDVMSQGFRDLGSVFGPILEGMGNAFDDLAPAIDAFRKALLPILQTIGEDLGNALTTLGPVLAGIVDSFGKFLKAVQPLAPILVPLLGAILAFTAGGPVGVIAALAVAFGSLAAKSEGLRAGFKAFFDVLKPVIDQGLKRMRPLLEDLAKALGDLGKDLGPVAKALLKAFGPVVASQVKVFFRLLETAVKAVTKLVRTTSAILRGDWLRAWKSGLSLGRIFLPFFTLLTSVVRRVRSMVDGALGILRRFRDTSNRIWDSISKGVSDRVDRIQRNFNRIRDGIQRLPKIFRDTASAIGRAFSGIGDAIRSPLRAIRDKALVPFLKAIDKIPGVPNYWSRIPGFAEGGHTGSGSKYQVAGVVHADEFVMSKAARRRLERQAPGALDYMNRTGRWPDGARAFRKAARRARDGYAKGGRVYPVQSRTTGRGYPGHTGVDFPVPTGTKVMSAVTGLVTAVRHLTYSYGKHIRIQGNGVETIYAHLSNTLARVGQKVSAGQLIGYSGSTGNSTGPHLHFEVRPPGTQSGTAAWLAGADSVAPHKGFSIPNPKDFLKNLSSSGFMNSRDFFSSISKDVLEGLSDRFGIFDFLFDSGGVANGKGFMTKNTLEPERVLSPAQTRAFQQMVDANFGQKPGSQGVDMAALAAMLNSIQIVVQPGMDRRATAELWLNGKKYAEALA